MLFSASPGSCPGTERSRKPTRSFVNLLVRADLWSGRDCALCESEPFYRQEWGCDEETGQPIVLGDSIVYRCPHALIRENPSAARWGRWASKAHSFMTTGNLAVLTAHGDLSTAGEHALAIASHADADRTKEQIKKNSTRSRNPLKDVKWPEQNQT